MRETDGEEVNTKHYAFIVVSFSIHFLLHSVKIRMVSQLGAISLCHYVKKQTNVGLYYYPNLPAINHNMLSDYIRFTEWCLSFLFAFWVPSKDHYLT